MLLLLILAFLAGFIDSIAGGGGLIQLPAVMMYMPHAPVSLILGTNKFAGFAGTSVAALRYIGKTKVNWNLLLLSVVFALVFAVLGAWAVSGIDKKTLKPVIVVLMLLVGLYTAFKPSFGVTVKKTESSKSKKMFLAALIGIILGFYDGFFGPGTGSFLLFAYVGLFQLDFLEAGASAKIVNIATNLAALTFFYLTDSIDFAVAVPVAVANIAGSYLGASLAIKQGGKFIRFIFMLVVFSSIGKMVYYIVSEWLQQS